MNGYAGRLLFLDLTDRKVEIVPTSDFEEWFGGHGMGSAIFFETVKDKTIDGFDPANVITFMTSPFCGTLAPGAAARTEIQGIGVQSYPIGWFTRSNFGGRFAAMLKFAGWDGIVITGQADRPVWLDMRDGEVAIRECAKLSLWGRTTWECQEIIWAFVTGNKSGGWAQVGNNGGLTTQKPAVVAIGPAGENKSRMGCLIHDAANGAGCGGFGGILGAKNLKAISVIGTGGIKVHDPKALMKARMFLQNNYAFDLDNLKTTWGELSFHSPPMPIHLWRKGRPKNDQRPQACLGCHAGCRARFVDGIGNESSCYDTVFYSDANTHDIQRMSSDLLNQYGLNAQEMVYGLPWLKYLNSRGKLKAAFDFSDYGSFDFVERLVKTISNREGEFGDTVAEGFVRAADKWNRLETDLKTGRLLFPHWGLQLHRDPRLKPEWGYGTILGDREINEHCFDKLDWPTAGYTLKTQDKEAAAEEMMELHVQKMVPFQNDQFMLDMSEQNLYSEHMAKLVTWQRYYTRFYKQSALFCDWRWPDFMNPYGDNNEGATGIAEPMLIKAVTGRDISFLDGINMGRRIWNLDNAVWTLQGRHRDQVYFAEYIYTKTANYWSSRSRLPLILKKGRWTFGDVTGRKLDKKKFDKFKTRYYKLQEWDTATGWPTRKTLESLKLSFVADELEKNNKLGKN